MCIERNIGYIKFILLTCMIQIATPYPTSWIAFFNKFFLLSSKYLYWPWRIEKYPGKVIHIITCILIHSSLCVLNFMLLTYRPNFVEAACITHKVEPTWSTKWCNEFRIKSRIPKSQRAEGWVKQVHAHA